MSLVVETVQWSSLPDIGAVEPINEGDKQVLEEIREVLVRHNRMERFGVCLLHKHFDLNPNEIAVEYTDPDKRTSTVVVEPEEASAGENYIETNWRFSNNGTQTVTVCEQRCSYDRGHKQVHVKVAR